MSLGQLALHGRLEIRGRLQFRAADGSILKEVDIIDGSLPIVAVPPAVPALASAPAAPEPPNDHPA